MLSFLKYDIEYGELLLEDNFDGTEPIENKWEIGGGEWVKSNGLLRGEIRENRGGLIYSRQNISGDLIMDFTGKLIPPCDNDLNFTFRASGWNHEKNNAGKGYIGGLNGWWTSLTGLEKYPGCNLMALSGFCAVPGKEYHIQTGIVGSHCFLFVDGNLITLMSDPSPITDENCGKIGFGVYCSKAEYKNIKVFRPIVHRVERQYTVSE